ncbi:MAG: hypothetical protein CMJ64_05560 [Planctomycetaceae bacterium]|nr:hypothetical protein [Planctomycetaceae bacterium]
MTPPDTIWIDDDAAGFGWFVDASPWDDGEFSRDPADGTLRAASASPAVDQFDLLTVLMHELGHVFGLEHNDEIADGLMDDLLGVGVRRLRTAEHVDAIFNSVR